MIMNGIKTIRVLMDFDDCTAGEPIELSGKRGHYAGKEPVTLGSTACGCARTESLPVVIYPNEDGSLERQVVHFLDPPAEGLHGYSTLETVRDDDPKFGQYKELIAESPSALS
jgi:hypothetical protein